MRNRQAPFGFAIALILSGVLDTRSTAWGATPALQPSAATGVRTDRLSAAQLRRWRAIVAIVKAEDSQHRPLHPTLLGLFDAVNAGPHTVFIELLDAKSYVAGRFRITSVDVEGRAHQAVLILNLRAIDKASTNQVAARADGFIPFQGLTRYERYVEVLGHELVHAAWHLASTDRATLAYWLGSLEEWRRMPLKERRAGRRRDPRPRNTELVSVGWELERQAETAERAIWEELQAAKREPHSARAREESRSRATGLRVGGVGGISPGDAGQTASEEAIGRAVRLLPRRPDLVVLIERDHQSRPRTGKAPVEAFVIQGERVVYVVRNGVSLEAALKGRGIYDYVLATVIWHEMAHIDGADEAAAQEAQEQLWMEFILTQRVDTTRGMQYLALLRKRR